MSLSCRRDDFVIPTTGEFSSVADMRAEIEREQEAAIEEEIELRRQIQSTTEQRDTLRKQVVGLEVFSLFV